uniref:hypothetical protein n=1 Tax=Segatella hominis TaxID=2518605 RepID=UPI0040389990
MVNTCLVILLAFGSICTAPERSSPEIYVSENGIDGILAEETGCSPVVLSEDTVIVAALLCFFQVFNSELEGRIWCQLAVQLHVV